MKVLFINGSPRPDGNSMDAINLVKEFLKSEYETETINLGRLNIRGCIQCDDCKKNGGNCTQDEDTAYVINKIYESDLIIFAAPVYWWNITGQMKTIIDKFYSKEEEFNHINKKIGYITIGAAGQEDDQYHFIKKQLQYFADGFDWDIEFNISITADEKGDLLQDEDAKEDILKVIERTMGNLN